MKLDLVLNSHWKELKDTHPGVLNVTVGEKWIGGVNTHRPAITVFVEKKLPLSEIPAGQAIPATVDNVPTDVIELSPKTWTAGRTSMSELHPEDRKRRLGLIPENPPLLRAVKPVPGPASFNVDWRAWASLIQDQGN